MYFFSSFQDILLQARNTTWDKNKPGEYKSAKRIYLLGQIYISICESHSAPIFQRFVRKLDNSIPEGWRKLNNG